MKTLTPNKNLLTKTSQKKYFYISIIVALFFVFFFGVNGVEAATQTAQTSQATKNTSAAQNFLNAITTNATSSNFNSGTLDSTTTDLSKINFHINDATSSTSWLPDINKIYAPEIVAKNAVVYDITNKQFIYSKNADEPVPMASLVKVITAAVFLKLDSARQKQGDQTETVQIIKKGPGYNQGDRDLINGEFWKKENLIRYMLITSSNFAAQSLANSIIDDEFAFALLMNKTARDLGFKSFSFKNVSGLSVNNSSYNSKTSPASPTLIASSTIPKQLPSAIGSAKEIAILFNSIFTSIPFLGEASIVPEATFLNWSGNTHDSKNVNGSLAEIPNIVAGKTGTTEESGGNLMIIINVNQKKYAIVILGSTIEDRYLDTIKLATATTNYSNSSIFNSQTDSSMTSSTTSLSTGAFAPLK